MLERFTRGEPDPMVGVCLPWVFVPLSAPFFSTFGAPFFQTRDDFWFQFWVRFLVPILGTALFSFLLRFPKWEPKNGPKTGTANFGFGPGIFGKLGQALAAWKWWNYKARGSMEGEGGTCLRTVLTCFTICLGSFR